MTSTYRVERSFNHNTATWEIVLTGEGKIADCFDPNWAYTICDALNAGRSSGIPVYGTPSCHPGSPPQNASANSTGR